MYTTSGTLVSVIIPCFRQAHYLPAALRSCFAQTHSDLEIIVVNDGSDDDTEVVARGYRDQIRYVARPNGGLSAARNTGISLARGQYFKFLDADDCLHPEQIGRQVTAIKSLSNTVSLTAVRAYQDGNTDDFVDYSPTLGNFLPEMLHNPDCAIHGFLFPAGLVREVNGFKESCRIAEDWEFFCRLGRLRVAVVCDQQIGAYYRLRAGSMSSAKSAMTIEIAHQLVAMHDEFRNGPNREWFGSELLGAEQRTYRRLLLGRRGEPGLERQLLCRIEELRRVAAHPPAGRKFDLLARVIGFRRAVSVCTTYLKRVRAKPPQG